MINHKVVVRNGGKVVYIDGLFVGKGAQISNDSDPGSFPTKMTLNHSYLMANKAIRFGSSENEDGSISCCSPPSAPYSLFGERKPEDEDASNHFLASIDPVPSSMVKIKLEGCLMILRTQPHVSISVKWPSNLLGSLRSHQREREPLQMVAHLMQAV